jgi:homoserine kinase
MLKDRVRIRVPASTANLGPGFDSLGMALNLYTWIEMSPADATRITLFGEELAGLPTDKRNLVYQVAQQVFQAAGVSCPELEISMYSEIPLTRGLGSSASAIVGGLAAANALIGRPLTDDDLFQIATRLEDHPDNVGASLFGGIVVAYWDGVRAEHAIVEPHERLDVLAVIPDYHLSTEKARLALPRQVPLKDAVFNIGHAALLVAALAQGNLAMIRHAMKDALHQPYRTALVPGMARILAEAADHGALGAALSGAGPTMLAFADAASVDREELQAFMLNAFAEEGVAARALWLKPERQGVQVLAEDEPMNLVEMSAEGKGRT